MTQLTGEYISDRNHLHQFASEAFDSTFVGKYYLLMDRSTSSTSLKNTGGGQKLCTSRLVLPDPVTPLAGFCRFFGRRLNGPLENITLCLTCRRKYDIKGTTRGLSGVFLPLVMNPLCPLKYYDLISYLYQKQSHYLIIYKLIWRPILSHLI